MRSITIRTRIMLMLIAVGLLACAALGLLGSNYGQKVITKEVNDQLNLVLSSKKDQITSYLKSLSNVVEVMGKNPMVIESADEFSQAFYKLGTEKLNAECSRELNDYYNLFIDKLANNLEIKKDNSLYYPRNMEGCYLQYEYIVNNPNPLGEKDKLAFAKDSSAYSKIHKKYHPIYRELLQKYNFYDIFIVDLLKGDIVYSVYKETDYATNLYNGPYRSSNLAELTRQLQANSDLQSATWIDFKPYRPSYGAPAAFVGIPLTTEGRTVGGLIFQVPISEINRIMTGGQKWDQDGLGETGETFLVGSDHLMRSVSRFLIEDSISYRKTLLSKGESQKNISRMYRFGSTVLQQKIQSPALDLALDGSSGKLTDTDYRGEKVVRHYAPMNFANFEWAIVAKKDVKESFKPVSDFNRQMFIQTLVLILIITVISLVLASRFVKPVEKLTEAAKGLIKGDTSQRVEIKSKDEFGVLGSTFNTMIEQIDEQKTALNSQLQKNRRLAENFVPADFITRFEKGEKFLANEYSNVSLIAADIIGFGALTEKIGAKKSIRILNELVDAFDTAAEKNYIEKIRTVGDTYFAACGLFEPRLDHTPRIVNFAFEIKQLLQQVNLNRKIELEIQVSVHRGNVMAGIIGTNKFSFDVWGQTVNHTFNMNQSADSSGSVLASPIVREQLEDAYDFQLLAEKKVYGQEVYIVKQR